jgi:hypothetical protein
VRVHNSARNQNTQNFLTLPPRQWKIESHKEENEGKQRKREVVVGSTGNLMRNDEEKLLLSLFSIKHKNKHESRKLMKDRTKKRETERGRAAATGEIGESLFESRAEAAKNSLHVH